MTDVPEGHVPLTETTLGGTAPVETGPIETGPIDTGFNKAGSDETGLGEAASMARRRSYAPAVLLGASVLALLVAGYLFWEGRTVNGQTAQRLDAIEQQLGALDPRLKALEARPLPSPTDLRPLQQRLAELGQTLTALDQRVGGADQKLAALDQREAAFEQKLPPAVPLDPPGRAEIAGLAGRIDQLVARQNQIGEAAQADAAKVQAQIGSSVSGLRDLVAKQDQRIDVATRTSVQLDTLTSSAARLTAVQGASAALAAGRPLGALPGAPPALERFATQAPPTEAGLRLSFTQAADAARAAGLPPKTEGSLLNRMWARAQSTITVRQGDRVLVGDAISGVLAHAQDQVDAGDLAGTLHTLDQLAGPAAAAMQPWRQQAQSLLDAQSALLTMAHS